MASVFVQKCVSTFLSLNRQEAVRGFFLTMIGAFIAALIASYRAGSFPNGNGLQQSAIEGLIVGATYLTHKFFSGPLKSDVPLQPYGNIQDKTAT